MVASWSENTVPQVGLDYVECSRPIPFILHFYFCNQNSQLLGSIIFLLTYDELVVD